MKELQLKLISYKQQKEDAENKTLKYKEYLVKIKRNFEDVEKQYKDTENSFRLKLENHKILIDNNTFLKDQLDLSRKEILYLKLQVSKLEESEKKLHNFLSLRDQNAFNEDIESLGKDISQFNVELTTSTVEENRYRKHGKSQDTTVSAQRRIKDMEDSLKMMCEENEILKNKLSNEGSAQNNSQIFFDDKRRRNLGSISSSNIEENITTQSSQNQLRRKDIKSISPNRTVRSTVNSGEYNVVYARSPIATKRYLYQSKVEESFD